MDRTLDLVPQVTIHPDKICTYVTPHWLPSRPTKEKLGFDQSENDKKISHIIDSSRTAEGNVSITAKKKISKATDYLLLMSTDKHYTDRISGRHFKFKIAFVTLTLPSKQIHSDKVIKESCLNQFLVEVRRYHQVKNYIWRAEKQKNGNIHFHVLIDRFIPWQEIRDRWNRIVNKLGYVDQYRKDQIKWHKDGFRVRENLLPTWSKDKQFAAYKRGAKLHWNSPNSTDIHSIQKIHNLKSYISKYVTKESLETEKIRKKMYDLSKAIDQKPPDQVSRKKRLRLRRLGQKSERVERTEKVKGRIWGCNYELSNIKGFRADVDNEIWNEINEVVMKSDCKCYLDSYYQVFYINFKDLPKYGGRKLFQYFCSYIFDNFNFSVQSSIAA